MEIEIGTLVVKWSVKLTVPTDWQEQIQVGSRSIALRPVFDLKLDVYIYDSGTYVRFMLLVGWLVDCFEDLRRFI